MKKQKKNHVSQRGLFEWIFSYFFASLFKMMLNKFSFTFPFMPNLLRVFKTNILRHRDSQRSYENLCGRYWLWFHLPKIRNGEVGNAFYGTKFSIAKVATVISTYCRWIHWIYHTLISSKDKKVPWILCSPLPIIRYADCVMFGSIELSKLHCNRIAASVEFHF